MQQIFKMIIGIGGVSNSGKSTLAKQIEGLYPSKKGSILCMDDFTKPNLPYIKDHIDWEHPSTIDFERYVAAITKAKEENDLVIAEGIFAFYDKDLNDLYEKTVFIEIDKETFFARKQNDLRWGKEPQWYMEHIWESYLLFGILPREFQKTLHLNGKVWNMDAIMTYLADSLDID